MIRRFRDIAASHFKKRSYALNQLDVRLQPYIDFRNGFFVEVGANDGINQSNTFYFEKYKGWRGLLIEAIPALATKCRQNRPRCIVENCALVASDYTEKTVEMRYCNLMSVVKGGLNSEEDEQKHIQNGEKYLAENEQTYIVAVPAKTLNEVLKKHRIACVDLFSLDVEGYEAQVLKGIDFDCCRIEFMLVEVRYREEVESVISHLYKPFAVLNISESYSDILYRRK